MVNNLYDQFKQVNDLINKKINSTTTSKNTNILNTNLKNIPNTNITGNSVNSDVLTIIKDIQKDLTNINSKLKFTPSTIIDGLDVYSYNNNVIMVTEGKAITKNGLMEYKSKQSLESFPIFDTSIIDTSQTGTVFILISVENNKLYNNKTYNVFNDIILAKIIINVANAPIDDKANKNFSNNYIISGKDITFNTEYALDDSASYKLRGILTDVLAENITGTIKLNESLTIANQQNSVFMDSSSLKIKNNDVLLSEFNKDGTYFFNESGEILSQYTKDGALIGNINILADSIQSLNYLANQTGFKISSDGYAEFSDVKVRGNITALSGTIGKWIIGRDRLTDRLNTTGLAPQDYPFYAGSTFANRSTAPFRVDVNGELWATNAHIAGDITVSYISAVSGTIGGWAIHEDRLSGGSTVLYSSGLILSTNANLGGWIVGSTSIVSPNNRITLDSNTNSGQITLGDPSGLNIKLIGNTGGDAIIQSSNFDNSTVNPKGFRLNSNGLIEAVDGYFRGKLYSNVFVKNEVNVMNGDLILTTASKINQGTIVSSTVTVITLESASFSANDILKIGSSSERVRVTNVSGLIITVTRGYNSTTPDDHNDKSVIFKVGQYNTTNKGYIELMGSANIIKIHDSDDTGGTLTDTTVVELGLLTQGTKINQYGLYAQVADITGDITCNTLTANTAGTIAGWNITAGKLSGGVMQLYSSGVIHTPYFNIDSTGKLSATGANITGTLSLSSGDMAGFTITATQLSAGNGNISLNSSNKSISINSNTFGQDGIQLQYNSGNPRAYIGNGSTRFLNFDGSTLSWQGSGTSLTTAGLFTATNAVISGAITCSTLTAKVGGNIGGWSISSTKLSGGAMSLYANGSIHSTNFNVTTTGILSATSAILKSATVSGAITCSTLTAKVGGNIAGFNITTSILSASNGAIVLDAGNKRIKLGSGTDYLILQGGNNSGTYMKTANYIADETGFNLNSDGYISSMASDVSGKFYKIPVRYKTSGTASASDNIATYINGILTGLTSDETVTIYIPDGTYNLFTTSINLTKPNITIYGDSISTILTTSASINMITLVSNFINIDISNYVLTRTGTSASSIIRITQPTFDGIYIHDLVVNCGTSTIGVEIDCEYGHYIKLHNTTINITGGNTCYGLYFRSVDNSEIIGCRFVGTGLTGIGTITSTFNTKIYNNTWVDLNYGIVTGGIFWLNENHFNGCNIGIYNAGTLFEGWINSNKFDTFQYGVYSTNDFNRTSFSNNHIDAITSGSKCIYFTGSASMWGCNLTGNRFNNSTGSATNYSISAYIESTIITNNWAYANTDNITTIGTNVVTNNINI